MVTALLVCLADLSATILGVCTQLHPLYVHVSDV